MVDTRPVLAAIFLLGFISCIQARLVDTNLPEMLELNATSVVHELKMATFNDTLEAVKAPWALVEFYASWQARLTLFSCPACKAFKSHYERVAVLFDGPDAPYQDFIYVANLECWTQGAMCQRFGVDKYPIMVFGKPSDIAVGHKDETFTSPGLEYIDNFEFGETKKAKLQEMITTPLGLPAEQEKMGSAAVQLQLHDVEEATSIAFQFIFNSVPLTKSARAPFLRFLHIVAAHHPSVRCRTGGAQILAQMDELWPPPPIDELGKAAPINKSALAIIQICGPSSPKGFWKACKGSSEERRGYTCGLWLLFHALVVRLDEFEAALWLPTLRGFIDKFFGCATCRAHFLEMADREEAKAVTSRRDAVLWLWAAHNEVNERLAKEEAEPDGSQGDPAFPKQQWPPVELCPACQAVKPVDGVHVWDKDAVYVFLVTYYGNTATPSGCASGGSTK
eukprot:SM000063S19993  [mRNA]  locus=s63:128466:132447:- [translate_table: standard]